MGTTKIDRQEINALQLRRNQRNKRLLPAWIGICLCLICCIACREQAFYEQYTPIESRHWAKEAEYFFSFEITDTSVPYDLTIEIRNNNLYPYQNLWLFSREELPSGQTRTDTTECILADDYGKWLGTGISLFQSSHSLHRQYFFREKGHYTISFRQGMRNDQLPGIQEIGLRIDQNKMK